MKNTQSNLKRLITKANKNNIDISHILKGRNPNSIKGNALKSAIKLIRRAIERPKIIAESKQIDVRMKQRVMKKNKKALELKREKLNEKFLKKYPIFKQVLKYDVHHNKSGDAILTAQSYMRARKQELKDKIFSQFPYVSDNLRAKLEKIIDGVGFDAQKLRVFDEVSQNLIYKDSSDASDIEIDLDMYDVPDDNYVSRLIERFRRVK